MKNLDVVKLYVAGAEKGKTTNLKIRGLCGDYLVNYDTCLVQRLVDESGYVKYIVNETKYSSSTSRIQSMIRQTIPTEMIHEIITGIPVGTKFLI